VFEIKCSPFEVGESSRAVDLYQCLIGREETGVWTEEDEIAYSKYMFRQNWEIFFKAINCDDGPGLMANWVYF